jgi:hypothetical protein
MVTQQPFNPGALAGYVKSARSKARTVAVVIGAAATWMALPASAAPEHGQYVVRPVTEMKIRQLPAGPIYWRIENFATLAQAKAAAGEYRWNPNTVSYEGSPSLVAEVAGKVWLFTLGAKGGATSGGSRVAEIGPLPVVAASEYLLRITHGSGSPGSNTPVPTHPGSDSIYVVAGRLGQRTPEGVRHVEAGQTLNGQSADVPMEVFNSGTTDLTALIVFVVDADRPFSVPAKMPPH